MGLISREASYSQPGLPSHTSVPAFGLGAPARFLLWLFSGLDNRAGRDESRADIAPKRDHQFPGKADN